jgi:Bacterial toxin 44
MTREIRVNSQSWEVETIQYGLIYGRELGRAADGILRFKELVQTGGRWDHKGKIQQMQCRFDSVCTHEYFRIPGTRIGLHANVWSNIHYGYVGTVAGFDEQILQKAADAGSLPVVGPSLEPITGISTPGDRLSIQIGIDLAKQYPPTAFNESHLHQSIVQAIPSWQQLKAIQVKEVVGY